MFGFPSYNRTTYNTNFLRELTLQLKFPRNLAILTKREDFVKILSPLFPNCLNLESSTITFGANSNNKFQGIPKSDGLAGFSFSSKDSIKQFKITSDSIVISYNGQAYSNFEMFWNEISPLIKTILNLVSIDILNWVSIRKINLIQLKIDGPNHAYEGLGTVFNSALVNQYLTIPSNTLLVSGLSNFVLKGDKKNLKLVYGLLPSSDDLKELVLDIDLFCDNQQLSFDELKDKCFEVNQEIFNVFHWSLLDNRINHLNR